MGEKAEAYRMEMKEWSEDFLAGLDESVKVLRQDGSINSALIELKDTITKIGQHQTGGTEGVNTSEALNKLNTTMLDLKSAIGQMSGGDGRFNEELLNTMKGVAAAANQLGEQIKKEVLLELKGIGESMGNVAQTVDHLKQVMILPEAKKGLFGWIKGK